MLDEGCVMHGRLSLEMTGTPMTLQSHSAFKSYTKLTLEARTGVLDKNKIKAKETLRNNMRFIWPAL